MIRFTIFLLSVLSLLGAASSTLHAQGEWRFGPRIGLALTGAGDIDGGEGSTGLYVGGMVQWNFLELGPGKLGAQGELNIIGFGYDADYNFPPFTEFDLKARVTALEIPIQIRYGIPVGEVEIFANTGFSYIGGLSGRVEASGTILGVPFDEEETEDIAESGFGWVFGFGAGFPVGGGKLTAEFRYGAYGFTIDGGVDGFETGGAVDGVFLGVGYVFGGN